MPRQREAEALAFDPNVILTSYRTRVQEQDPTRAVLKLVLQEGLVSTLTIARLVERYMVHFMQVWEGGEEFTVYEVLRITHSEVHEGIRSTDLSPFTLSFTGRFRILNGCVPISIQVYCHRLHYEGHLTVGHVNIKIRRAGASTLVDI